MTISTETSSITYVGNGATSLFTFPFVGVNASDIEVIYTDNSGTSTVLNPSVYTLVINPVPVGGLWGIGGSVQYPNTGSPPVPIQVGSFLTINRIVPYTQDVSIGNQGAFYPQAVEQGLDKLELQIQQVATSDAFAIKAPITDLVPPNVLPPAAERANGFLGFDGSGQPIIVPNTSGGGGGGGSNNGTPQVFTVTGTNTITLTSVNSFNGASVYQTGPATTTVQLPAAAGPYLVVDSSNNANTYPIRILPPSGQTIGPGFTSYYLNFNGESVTFYNDGITILAT